METKNKNNIARLIFFAELKKGNYSGLQSLFNTNIWNNAPSITEFAVANNSRKYHVAMIWAVAVFLAATWILVSVLALTHREATTLNKITIPTLSAGLLFISFKIIHWGLKSKTQHEFDWFNQFYSKFNDFTCQFPESAIWTFEVWNNREKLSDEIDRCLLTSAWAAAFLQKELGTQYHISKIVRTKFAEKYREAGMIGHVVKPEGRYFPESGAVTPSFDYAVGLARLTQSN